MGLAQSLALMPGVSRSGDHDHGRTPARPRPGLRRALLLPTSDPDRPRRRRLQGAEGRALRRPTRRVGGAVRGRHDRRGRQRAPGGLGPARVRPPSRLLAVRRLPPARGGRRAAADRRRRPRRDVLGPACAAPPRPTAIAGASGARLLRHPRPPRSDVEPATAAVFRWRTRSTALWLLARVESRRHGRPGRRERSPPGRRSALRRRLCRGITRIAAVGRGATRPCSRTRRSVVALAAWALLERSPQRGSWGDPGQTSASCSSPGDRRGRVRRRSRARRHGPGAAVAYALPLVLRGQRRPGAPPGHSWTRRCVTIASVAIDSPWANSTRRPGGRLRRGSSARAHAQVLAWLRSRTRAAAPRRRLPRCCYCAAQAASARRWCARRVPVRRPARRNRGRAGRNRPGDRGEASREGHVWFNLT